LLLPPIEESDVVDAECNEDNDGDLDGEDEDNIGEFASLFDSVLIVGVGLAIGCVFIS
jgi:hypothetical protein